MKKKSKLVTYYCAVEKKDYFQFPEMKRASFFYKTKYAAISNAVMSEFKDYKIISHRFKENK
jgi:hypothetical protein